MLRGAAIRAAAEAVGARKVRVFGSVARGDETPDSDVDLLVDFPAGEQRHALLSKFGAVEYPLAQLEDVPTDARFAPVQGRDFEQGFLPCILGDFDVADDSVLAFAG